MFTKISLENFKGFGAKEVINLAPITLIFGENSAGKSSLLEALVLLKQTVDSGDTAASLLPRTDTSLIDLGSYSEFVHDHNVKKQLTIGLEVDASKLIGSRSHSWGPDSGNRVRDSVQRNFSTIGLSFTFKQTREKITIQKIKLTSLMRDLVSFVPVSSRDRNHWHSLPGRAVGRNSRMFTTAHSSLSEPYKSLYRVLLSHRKFVQMSLESLRTDFRSTWLVGSHAGRERHYRRRRVDRMLEAINDAITFYDNDFSFDEFLERLTEYHLSTRIAIRNFLPVEQLFSISNPPDALSSDLVELLAIRRAQRPTRSRHRDELDDDEPEQEPLPIPPAELSREVKNYLGVHSVALGVGQTISEFLDRTFFMAAHRTIARRHYQDAGRLPMDVGLRGENMPDLLKGNTKACKEVNRWLKKLDTNYEVKTFPIGGRGLYEVRLLDLGRSPEPPDVSLADVGLGLSYILPFIVQTVVQTDQVIAIEEPEVHVHPRLQADVGDLLAEGVKKRNHQFLITTHSEHLIMRLQTLIGKGELNATDVSVVFVSRSEEGSKIEHLRIDKNGDFLDEPDKGFFGERLTELKNRL